MLNFKASAIGLERLKTMAMAGAVRCGALYLARNIVTVRRSEFTIDTHLSDILEEQVHVALYVGPQRAVQKPIFQVIDHRGHTVAFAKLGTRELTKRLIRHEVESLETLRRLPLSTIATPRVLAHTTWHDAELIVQSAVLPGRRSGDHQQTLTDATNELASCIGACQTNWDTSAYRSRLWTRILSTPREGLTAALRSAMMLLDAALGSQPVDMGAWHGDWAPWNMTSQHGKIIAWDWEHFEVGVPKGLDAVHYDIATLLVDDGVTPVQAFHEAADERHEGLLSTVTKPSSRAVLIMQYAIEIATRYMHDGEDLVGGTRLSRLETWLPQVLSEFSARISHVE